MTEEALEESKLESTAIITADVQNGASICVGNDDDKHRSSARDGHNNSNSTNASAFVGINNNKGGSNTVPCDYCNPGYDEEGKVCSNCNKTMESLGI